MTDLLIRNRTFARPVRIENWTDPRPLVFCNCRFHGGFFARGAKVDRGLDFITCTFGPLKEYAGCEDIALDFSNARLEGDLVLFDCQVRGRFFAQGLRARCNVRLQGCRISSVARNPPHVIKACDVFEEGGRVEADFDERNSKLVVFDRATIGGNFEIFSAGQEMTRRTGAGEVPYNLNDCASVIVGRFSCEAMEIMGNVTLRCLIVVGSVFFDSSQVAGNFDFMWARIEAVSLYGATIGGFCRSTGLVCMGDMNLSFLTSKYFAAYRDSANNAALDGRRSLYIGRDLLLSGANIRIVELRAVDVARYLKARTGEFGAFTLGFGVEPTETGMGTFWPVPCTARAVSLTSIHVGETLDMGGIRIVENRLREPTEDKRYGLELLNSPVDGAVVLSPGDGLLARLQARWGAEAINWGGDQEPEAPEFATRIAIGDLVIRACRIGGDLDLRHVHLDGGGVLLNDTSVGLRLRAGPKVQASSRRKSDFTNLTTSCLYLDAENVSCRNDVDLAGIQIGRVVGGHTNAQSGDVGPLVANSIESRSDERENIDSEVKKREVGNVSLRGAHIAGDLLFAQATAPENESPTLALISGNLNLTAIRCEKLVLSGNSFISDSKNELHGNGNDRALPRPARASLRNSLNRAFEKLFRHKGKTQDNCNLPSRAVLARGHFGQVDIFDWTPQPIDLRHITVDSWGFGADSEQTRKDVDKYLQTLGRMNPEDRSTWLSVESELRNKSYEREANRFYLKMEWHSIQQRWIQRTHRRRIWRALEEASLLQLQRCFLFAKANFMLLLAFTVMTMVCLTCAFCNPGNVRATVGYLHALPEGKRAEHPSLEIHPYDVHAEWHYWDAIALALRYHVPLFESRTHDRWEASGREVELGTIGNFHLASRMETIALLIEVFYWVMLPILLLGFAAWAFRKRDTD